ncbi:vWA domain-containing protein [Lederbergia lenta]|uniref:VWA-like protein n=1 Tax=Lederbergia lenta TaxID=1467 RepID=A0A2X4VG21_LEDLE|nr:VWA domain-containing protein [Lederbergia lenta]MCM3113574.1 VWA domain-containing protein [Lederbergia lenta]MEC2323843.1 VWA domain-containing protein [Lederbergia lenta]SQI51146.1 vWA-like protein [Lederbergia lenta]
MTKGSLKQILLITDGCSNQGEDPVAVAALANESGITVNVIGVIENDSIEKKGMKEIDEIAASGGGISQIVYAEQLSQTVQMVTRKAMTQTLQGVVNRELRQILGSNTNLEELSPDKRGEVMEVVDELGETSDLQVLIMIDTSASMATKLETVKEALLDLSLSLNARMGNNQFSVLVFPGKRKEAERLLNWTPNLELLTSVFPKLATGGITPTGPALREGMSYFKKKRSLRRLLSDDEYMEGSI